MTKRGDLPPAINFAGFTVRDAQLAGASRSRLRARDLASPFRGVRTVGPTRGILALARAYSSKMMAGQFFSHTTAAILLGLRMPESFREVVLHVSSLSPHRAVRAAGIVGHRADHGTVVRVGTLRVLSPVAVWVQLSSVLSVDDLVIMGDGLVRRRSPLATMEELTAAVRDYRGRGVKRLRSALALIRPGTDSARETMLRLFVIRAGFPEPEVNAKIFNEFGAEIGHGDLVFRRYRTILEYEGQHHASDPKQFAIDIARLDEFMEEDWRVIRVDKALLARRAVLRGKIERALRAGGWTPEDH